MSALNAHVKKYAKNLEMMIRTIDKPAHSIYVKMEIELNIIGIKLRRKLGILAKNPCPYNHSKDCFKCKDEECHIKREVMYAYDGLRSYQGNIVR